MKLRSLVFLCFGTNKYNNLSLSWHLNGADQPSFGQGGTTSGQYTLPGLGVSIVIDNSGRTHRR